MINLEESQIIILTPFALHKIRIISNKCRFLIANHTFLCTPYILAKKCIQIMCPLNESEFQALQRLKNSYCFFTIEFQNAFTQKSILLHVQTRLNELVPISSRQNIYQVYLSVLHCPQELSLLITKYLAVYDILKVNYEKYKDRYVYPNGENSNNLPFTTYSVCTNGTLNSHIQIYKLSTKYLVYSTPEIMSIPFPESHTDFCLSIYNHNIKIPGIAEYSGIIDSDIAIVKLKNDFSPEITEFVTHYFETGHGGTTNDSKGQLPFKSETGI